MNAKLDALTGHCEDALGNGAPTYSTSHWFPTGKSQITEDLEQKKPTKYLLFLNWIVIGLETVQMKHRAYV